MDFAMANGERLGAPRRSSLDHDSKRRGGDHEYADRDDVCHMVLAESCGKPRREL